MVTNSSSTSMPDCAHIPQPYDGPTRKEVLLQRRQYVSPGIFTFYKDPLLIVEGHMQYLWDETGKRYLDGIGGIVTVSVGHCHPHIVEAVKNQIGKLFHTTTIYLHPHIGRLAKLLAEHFPTDSGLEVTYFTNSGTESNEVAVLMARLHTGHHDVISLRNGYHGGSQVTMGLTGMGTWKFPLPQAAGVHHAMPGYCYRCPLGLEYPTCNVKCAQDVAQLIDYQTSGKIAAFIAEPIQGAGGVVDPPESYFKIIQDIVHAHGGLFIADEVQTGFGRTGTHFWGFEHDDVIPDIVTMAKGIGNGAPLGAVTTRMDIAQCLKQKLHFNTFGGNPVAMIQGLATLEIIDRDRIQQNATTVGAHLKQRLKDLQTRQPLIGDVRGRGLLLGVELVRNPDTKEPATTEAIEVLERTRTAGLLIGRGGVYGNVLRVKPPMCVTIKDVDFLVDTLDAALSLP